ncbi:MAG TPA: DUF4197 domain-containing protein [Saprospiraceae bacterium]|mgnify:CR=1 FL=1|nr:DUF4197 domain-containing protein [Saprospiraceae bacterium]HMP14917.1 DUF4197 domain-containing protein [Saprospiraceae bacterium]
MLKKLSLLMLAIALAACDSATLQQLGSAVGAGALTEADMAAGLKEALNVGIGKGAEQLSAVDGYFKSPYKILLPPEARKITDRLQGIPGFSDVEAEILQRINRGAEDAANKAKPIFINAIKQMTFADVTNILMGADDAATQYLNRTTRNALYQEFNPVIIESLDKFQARKYWSDAVTAYNRIPLVERANPNLDDYVTNQALDGLFSMVSKEELNIRKNVNARTSDLLRRVFARQDNK